MSVPQQQLSRTRPCRKYSWHKFILQFIFSVNSFFGATVIVDLSGQAYIYRDRYGNDLNLTLGLLLLCLFTFVLLGAEWCIYTLWKSRRRGTWAQKKAASTRVARPREEVERIMVAGRVEVIELGDVHVSRNRP